DPEEDDVAARDHETVGVVALEVGRLLRPAERGERPQPRAEPGVEHVVVLAPALPRRRLRRHHHLLAAIPDGAPVPPPELPRAAPVADVLEPVEVDLLTQRR